MTARPPGGSPSGAARFSPPPAPRERRGFSAFAAALALLGLVAGVPAILLWLAGPTPWPKTAPKLSDLTHTVDFSTVLSVLVIVVWLAWLQFMVCVVVEVAAALRGGVLAVPIPWSGPSQRLARLLVASILLAGAVVGQVSAAQAAVTSVPFNRAAASGRTVLTAAPFDATTSHASIDSAMSMNGSSRAGTAANLGQPASTRLDTANEVANQRAAAELDGARSVSQGGIIDQDELALDGRKVYVVEAPAGRHHDSLWAVAERHLGDGRRYQEIYRLNEGRQQPDGRTLHLAKLIQPGWRLIMPEDAVGVPRYVADRRAPVLADPAPGHADTNARAAHAAPAPAAPDQIPVPASPVASPVATPGEASAPAARNDVPPIRAVPITAPAITARPPAVAQPPANDEATPPIGITAVGRQPGEPRRVAAVPTATTTSTVSVAPTTPAASAVTQQEEAASADSPGIELPHLNPLGEELIGAGLLAAALLGTLLVIRRRRGKSAESDPGDADTEVWLRAGADADRGTLLDLALRSITRSCRDVGRQLPQAYGAVVDDDGLDLLLTMSHPSPPPPWVATDEGLRWRVTYVDAQHLVADGESAYPLLASVGRDPQGRDALINLGAAAGPIAVVGSPAMAAAVVRALALGLAGNPWSRGIEVLTCDLPATLPAIAAGRLVPCAGARDLTEHLEQGSGRLPRTGPIQILTGGPAPGSRPELVAIYGAPLTAPIAQRLQALIVRRTELAVLVTGELPGAAWRLKVDDAGNLNCDELSLSVTANRLGDGSIERLHALFIAASTVGPRPGIQSERVMDDAGVVETDDVTWAQANVRIAILGDVEVRAPGMIEAGRLPLFGEIVAYLALHPAGAHPTVLASAIWPRGVTSDVRDGTLAQVRDWLGNDPDGTTRLREGSDGRMRLSPEVPCDWDVLRTLVNRSGQAIDQSRERDLLIRALHLVRGPVVGGITHGSYSWLPRTDLERQAEELIVEAADRLSEICADEGDQVAVEQAAAAGLRAVPEAQHLWRHIIRAEHALGGPARLARVTEHLRFALSTSGVDVEPETQALIEHLTNVSASSGSAS